MVKCQMLELTPCDRRATEINGSKVLLKDRQAEHVIDVLKPEIGQHYEKTRKWDSSMRAHSASFSQFCLDKSKACTILVLYKFYRRNI
jgi:hypothetical protein